MNFMHDQFLTGRRFRIIDNVTRRCLQAVVDDPEEAGGARPGRSDHRTRQEE
jgi:hypothetical protein